jgi:FkbM family methyltransferase
MLHPGMTVLDIGANIGFYSLFFAKKVGEQGKVFAFEPDQTNYRHLRDHTKNIAAMTTVQFAVGETSGSRLLFYSDELNVDHQTFDNGEGRKRIEIEMIAIDDYFVNNETVDFVKLDIQGYDYFAIKGMLKTIQRSEKIKIFGEFWPYALYKAGVHPNDYIRLLKELGFKVHVYDKEDVEDFSHYIHDKAFYTDFMAVKVENDLPTI